MRFIVILIGAFLGSLPTISWIMSFPVTPLQVMGLVIEGEVNCTDTFVEFRIVIKNQQDYSVTITDGTPKLSGTFSIPAHGNQELTWKLYSVPEPTVAFSFHGIWKRIDGLPVGQGVSQKSINLTSQNCLRFLQGISP